MDTIHKIIEGHRSYNPHKKSLPENITKVLYFECYKKGLRSTKEINKKLAEHYHTPIEIEQNEIRAILKKRSKLVPFRHFNPEDIIE
jgi:hypothetical protein